MNRREKLKVKEHVEKVILDRTRMKYDFSFAFKTMNQLQRKSEDIIV